MQEAYVVLPNGLWGIDQDCLIDTGTLSSAIPEMDLRKIRLLSPRSVIREGPVRTFKSWSQMDN